MRITVLIHLEKEDAKSYDAVADQVTQAELDSGLLYPPQSNILETEVAVAVKVAETIFVRNLAGVEKPTKLNIHEETRGPRTAAQPEQLIAQVGLDQVQRFRERPLPPS